MIELGTAAVIGLGLIGGSVARELAVRGVRVLGYDTDPLARVAALRDGVVDVILPASLEGIEAAEVIVVAVPVRAAVQVLRSLGDCPGAHLVTDVGSTKGSILGAARESRVGDRFVGAHPLAGDHRSGWEASRLGLFRGARVYLCPADGATPEALALAEAFWGELGGLAVVVGEDRHDEALAWSSHLPQIASSALATALGGAGTLRTDLGPGGRDVSRLAASSPEIWTEIVLDNAAFVTGAVERLEGALAHLRGLLASGDEAGVRAWFQAAHAWSGAPPDPPPAPVNSVATG